jgi:hypothetical protein
MKLRAGAKALKGKAVSSLTRAVATYNSPYDDGRVTCVLLHLQHAFEMLLKAGLHQTNGTVFDKRTGRSITFDKAVALAQQHPKLKLTDAEAGTARAIDAMRDDEQHWFTDVSEGQLYLHLRAGVTLFDDLLRRAFDDTLADRLPNRVLPISVEPPEDFLQLVDADFRQIKALLRPGRRARAQARAKIRGLLALEAHVEPDTRVSDADVNRVEAGIKAGKTRTQVFPKLTGVAADVTGEGITVMVRFSKTDGPPVRLLPDADEAAAVREVDLQKKFHWGSRQLADKLSITTPKFVALQRHLGLDDDPTCRHEFVFDSSRIVRWSDNALTRARDALATLDMNEIWRHHSKGAAPAPRGTAAPGCTQPGCRAGKNSAASAEAS